MFEPGTKRASGASAAERQREVTRWFDQVYRDKGLAYLRPPQAYAVFLEMIAAQGETLAGRRLLDVACGPGLLLDAAGHRGMVTAGIDVSSVALRKAQSGTARALLVQGSAELLPYGDDTFDAVTCLGSLERFLAPERALAEIRRVLRRRGVLVLMVRNSRTLTWSLLNCLGLRNETGHQGAADHKAWTALLAAAGFRVAAAYPDQWPLMRGNRLRQALGGTGDFTTIRRSRLPLAFANELIYVCRPESR